MKEALVGPGPKVEIVDSPIPKPNADQILIKVVVSGSNPKDWKVPNFRKDTTNQGDDIAGIVEEVGSNVTEFKPGDRVAALHEVLNPVGGSYAEYAISYDHAAFHLPQKTTFEEGSTIPLAALTAVVGLYSTLGLPQPWLPATEPTPLVVYSAASAVGAFAVQLARKSNIHPIIAVAGKSQAFVETLIDRSKGDTIIDYRIGDEAVVEALKKALGESKLLYAFDAVSEHGSYVNLSKVLAQGSKLALVLPAGNFEFPSYITASTFNLGPIHKNQKDLGFVYSRFFTRGLQEGWLKAHPQEIVPGGLGGIQKALEDLQAGKANAIKYVFRIADTK
ncbi:GroES-like protein [Hypoxylon trugodes]|uniref:GroES-like protein n=1 Tax=Hypoxylon trugodes TaxID=326681 RepID=UPI002198326B|nr:GroES-like protein [Hypoxylon trugodes]KAI1383948.1 GroES-like protein [Hypoxylon trugodes]